MRLCGVVMGTVRPDPSLWERYVEHGGACFDSARHYGDESEGALGAFLERHGLRERVVLVGKAAHTPRCAPEHVAEDVERSLELLRTDALDVLLLHRDDPEVPVEAWSDALEPIVAAGRARTIGASNWTAARFEEFNRRARRGGRTPFSLLSNQLSLAEMLEPVWSGCLRADIAWHETTGTPLLAWSAQGRGFFSGRPDDEEMRRSWLAAGNVERRRRAGELACRHGVAPVSIALAWLLARPFPVHAAVGPRDVQELDACLAALEIRLSEEELRWLEQPARAQPSSTTGSNPP